VEGRARAGPSERGSTSPGVWHVPASPIASDFADKRDNDVGV
jgi:hypothetical protein